MIKKKVRRVIGLAIIASLSINSFAYGTVQRKGDDYEKLINTIGANLLIAPEDYSDQLKISNEIDTTSDESISVIVEFVSEPTLQKGSITPFSLAKLKVDRDHRVFNNFLANMPTTYGTESLKIKESYTVVYNGVAMDIKANEIEKLLNCGVVKRVYKDRVVKLDEPKDAIAKVQTNEIDPYMMDSVPYLDINDLHEEGVVGSGIKVGVLDTGIDYNHPDLTNVYKGFRSENGDPTAQEEATTLGWDFIDNDADPMETTYENWQNSGAPEFDDYGTPYYTAHGTHVSGTIAGQGINPDAETPVLGVAPEVELYGYRVLGPGGSGSDSGIIAGIEKAVRDGMDVINLSLGTAINDPFFPTATAVNNATLAGVVTVIAAGNSGPNATTVGSPGTAQLPITVGASTVDFTYDTYTLKLGETEITADVMIKDLEASFDLVNGKELEMVYCGLGSNEDFQGLDLQGKVAVIDRGTVTFNEKALNAKKAGAALVILINNVEDGKMPYLGEKNGANTLAISLADGDKLKEMLANKVLVSFAASTTVKGDEITDFSSTGPVGITAEIRPDIVAPGSQVYSSVPEYINDKNVDIDNYKVAYERMSGTSMAAPHVAGIAALLLQAHPEYTPEDVKAAIMNTSENIHKKDGSDYSVHQVGAGRVNPYKAVHEDVSFKATYKVHSGYDRQEFANTTGMLSFGKVFIIENEISKKTIPVTITNNSTMEKKYNVTVEYSNSERALDAEKNGVTLKVVDTITVKSGESQSFNAELSINSSVEKGIYEGYIHFVEVGNESNDYQMPFSGTATKEGFASIYYPSAMDGSLKGISGFNTSALFNKSPFTYYTRSDIEFAFSLSGPMKTIKTFVKDSNSGKYLGSAGEFDASWMPEGMDVMISNVLPSGKMKKIINGNVSHEEIALAAGIYDLEVVAVNAEGKEFKETLPICIINDTSKDTVTFNMNEGIIKVTEDMFTKELWYDGLEYEGLWIKANVFNDYLSKLKTQKGMDYLRQNQLNSFFITGFYPNGEPIGMASLAQGENDILFAGVEKSDLEEGFFRVEAEYVNAATVTDKPYNFILVNEGTKFLSIETKEDKLTEGSYLNSTIKLNSPEDVAEGIFVINNLGDADLEIESIEPSKALKEILKDNNNDIDFSYSVSEGEFRTTNFNISFKLTGNNIVGINEDVDLFNIKYKVKSLKGIDQTMMDDSQYRYNTLSGVSGEFKNSSGENIDVKVGTIRKNITVESKERTLIYGNTSTPTPGMKDAKVYAVSPSGEVYEPTYFSYNEMMERGHSFAFNNLPVISGEYRVILQTPGAFDSIINVPGSRVNKDNETIGNIFAVTSYTFTGPAAMMPILGDVNGDGAIDIIDAMAIGKEYKPGAIETPEIPIALSEDNLVTDLTQDGIVNMIDMDILLSNYLKQDFTRSDSNVPEEVSNGYDIYDVLESSGYFDEITYMNVNLELDKDNIVLGQEVNLKAVPPEEGIDFKYEFAVRGENDTAWTVIREKALESTFAWTPETAGKYAIRVRITFDGSDYLWQDNKLLTVNSVQGDNGNTGGNDKPEVPVTPGTGGNTSDTNKPGSNDSTNSSKIPTTGAVVGSFGFVVIAGALIATGVVLNRKREE